VPFLVWDNIEKGALVSCPHIEKALTAETYSDRLLGASRSAAPFASAVQAFTGNNIGPKGDLASRSLIVRLPVTRPDPENRDFTHPDPFGWTLTNRGKILTALYTILLGNPRRKQQAKDRTSPPTRFKSWWELVGSAVEHAAQHHQRIAKETTDWLIAAPPSCPPEPISFRDLFLGGEAEDEQANALVEVLTRLRGTWPNGEKFEAREVMSLATEDPKFRAALEQASGKAIKEPSPTILAWRLKALRDAPVLISNPAGQQVVALRYSPMTAQKNDPARFWVEPV